MNSSRERDQAVERWLRQPAEEPDAGITPSCLDAETLAALFDGAVSGPDLEAAQLHLSECTRCQSLAAALAQIEPAAPTATPRRAFGWLPWLAPTAAAAAAVVFWFATPSPSTPRVPSSIEPPAQQEFAPATQSPEPSRQRAEPPSLKDSPPSTNTVDRLEPRIPGGDAKARHVEAPLTRELRQSAAAPAADQVRQAPGAPGAGGSVQVAAAKAAEQTAPAAAPGPATTLKADAAADSAATALQQAAPAAAPRFADATRLAVRAQAALVEIPSPSPLVRWRLTGGVLGSTVGSTLGSTSGSAGGTIVQRSTDGGMVWDTQSTGTVATLIAGSAPSTLVCWVVGRGGVVLLSTDGRAWRRLAFPETADLSSVRALDASRASISTADGRPFSTTDGGATWVPRPLQEF